MAVIAPGTAVTQFGHSAPSGLRESLGLEPGARLLVCIGPLEPHKGYREAIWAFDILNYLYDDLHLIFIGDGSERPGLEDFVRTIRTTARIHFLGNVPDLPPLLAQADVVWIPNPARGGVQTALEAMAAGRPVVARNSPWLSELVLNGTTGYLVPAGDQPAFARQTRLLLDDPELRRRMGEAGRRRVDLQFNRAAINAVWCATLLACMMSDLPLQAKEACA